MFGEQIYPAVPATLLARPDFFIPFVFWEVETKDEVWIGGLCSMLLLDCNSISFSVNKDVLYYMFFARVRSTLL